MRYPCVFVSLLALGLASGDALSLNGQGRGRGGSPPAGRTGTHLGSPSSDRSTTARGANPEEIKGGIPATAQSHQKSIQEQLANNTHLSARMESLLPAGASVPQRADGFRNVGEFVATVHVSRNLDIPFDQLKQQVLAEKGSLGKAIETLKPELGKKQIKQEVKRAQGQAKQDIESSAKTSKGETGSNARQ